MRRLAIAILLVAGLIWLGARAVPAGQRHPAKAAWEHVVRPGETLWGLARDLGPDRDPRELVQQMVAENHLRGGAITPGTKLTLHHL